MGRAEPSAALGRLGAALLPVGFMDLRERKRKTGLHCLRREIRSWVLLTIK
jgi:hypothetical protein